MAWLKKMAYKFIEMDNGHRYRLVQAGLLWNSKYDVYLDPNSIGRFGISAIYQGKKVESHYKSSVEASQLAAILHKLGIKKEDLQKAKFPQNTEPKVMTEWGHILAWLSTTREA